MQVLQGLEYIIVKGIGINTSITYNFISFIGINYIIMFEEGVAKTLLLLVGDLTI
jgi:hypothetical protein